MSLEDSKTSLKINRLAKAIVLCGKRKGEDIAENSANLTVRILLLRPKWHIILTHDLTEENVKDFVEACIKYLLFDCTVSSVTIKMQSFFHGNYLNREEFKERYRQIKANSYSLLLQKIRKSWHNPSENLEHMHDDIVHFILIKEGMDDESDVSAFIEIKSAVCSVFPPSALSTFVLSNQKTKMNYLNEISSIAVGIRLYTWYKNKAGQFMFNVAKIMKETLPKITEELQEEFQNIKGLIENYQKTFVENILYKPNVDSFEKEYFHQKLLLICLINYKKFIKTIMADVADLAVKTYKLDYTFTVQLGDLDRMIRTSAMVKADIAFPSYKTVAELWKSMQLECHRLSFYIAVFNDIKSLKEKALAVTEKNSLFQLEEILKHEVSLTAEDSNEKETDEVPIMLSPESVKNFDRISLQHRNYCTWACTMGVLIECDRDLGIAMYKDSCYGFSSEDARKMFMENPNYCVKAVTRVLQAIPELVFTLQLESTFHLPVINKEKCREELPIFVFTQSTQTVLHPIEEHIDYSYRWNQWDLRRDALKHVDLLNKRTSSTQTDLSHFRRENYSQVYLPKDNWTQTKLDKSTATSKAGFPDAIVPFRKGLLKHIEPSFYVKE